MTLYRLLMGAVLLLSTSACSMGDYVSRNAPYETIPEAAAPQLALAAPRAEDTLPPVQQPRPAAGYKVVDYEIKIPSSLTISEANMFLPIADIVWRGDPRGDRRTQIGAMFQNGLDRAKQQVRGTRDVKAIVTLSKFHSLTEKTRYTVGGNHAMRFTVTLVDVTTGAVLVNNRPVKADLKAYGGARAVQAEAQGYDMKTRIQNHLSRVFTAELTQPHGWNGQGKKLARAINQI